MEYIGLIITLISFIIKIVSYISGEDENDINSKDYTNDYSNKEINEMILTKKVFNFNIANIVFYLNSNISNSIKISNVVATEFIYFEIYYLEDLIEYDMKNNPRNVQKSKKKYCMITYFNDNNNMIVYCNKEKYNTSNTQFAEIINDLFKNVN